MSVIKLKFSRVFIQAEEFISIKLVQGHQRFGTKVKAKNFIIARPKPKPKPLFFIFEAPRGRGQVLEDTCARRNVYRPQLLLMM